MQSILFEPCITLCNIWDFWPSKSFPCYFDDSLFPSSSFSSFLSCSSFSSFFINSFSQLLNCWCPQVPPLLITLCNLPGQTHPHPWSPLPSMWWWFSQIHPNIRPYGFMSNAGCTPPPGCLTQPSKLNMSQAEVGSFSLPFACQWFPISPRRKNP